MPSAKCASWTWPSDAEASGDGSQVANSACGYLPISSSITFEIDAAETAGKEASADALDRKADATREAAEAKGDAIEQEAGKKD